MSVAAIADQAPPHISRSDRPLVALLLLPGLAAIAVTFLLPLLWLVRISFSDAAPGIVTGGSGTLANYVKIVTDPFYWRIAWNTILLAAVVCVLATTISYPVALFLARTNSRWRGVLAALAIAPLLTSTVVRTYGWMVILSDQGVINGSLLWLGIIDAPFRLANNFTAAVIALTEILMPYAILAMLSGLGRLNSELEGAAALLGANRWKIFSRIILPLSLPGIATGALLVFVLCISSFVTPRLMGGGRVFVFGTEIYSDATATLDWTRAAALSILLLVLFSCVIFIYQRIMKSIEL